jgi:hypothetical protein
LMPALNAYASLPFVGSTLRLFAHTQARTT